MERGRSGSTLAVSLICLILVGVRTSVCSSGVTILDNGYSGIVVAFAPHINQSVGEPLLAQIKELFINASAALHKATRHRAYFKEVTILVPQEWERKSNYETAGSEVFGEADIRIDDPNPEYNDGPYTLQPLGCGSPGLFIHLTPSYLRNLKNTSSKYFGDPGKTLVHEWAHLRYGIFDEFGYTNSPDGMFPMAYYDDEDLLPNSCTNGRVSGIWMDVQNEAACSFDSETGMPNDDCVFLPDLHKNEEIQSSLASYHFLPNVHTFCDDGEFYYHNPIPQNKHNVLCESQSTWSVIEQHSDFEESKNLPRADVEDLRPSFRIVQQMEATYCLVLDISSSMSTGNRKQILHDAVKRWLQEEVSLGSAVGIVTFSNSVTTVFDIKKITSEVDRRQIIAKIPNQARGSTRIGLGLKRGKELLSSYRHGSGGIIILVTDGEENLKDRPLIVDMIPELQRNQIRVVVIALHTTEGVKLQALAQGTGGKMFSVPVGSGIDTLGMAFYEALTYQASEFDLTQKIHSTSFGDRKPYLAGQFVIDATIGNETTVDITSAVDKDKITKVTIHGPNVNDDITKAALNDQGKLVRFKYPSLKVGVYKYNVTRTRSSEAAQIQVSVTSKARSATTQPITTRSWIQKEANSSPQTPRFVILAEVKQGNNPVINAAVMAKVDRPNKPSVTVQLFDNGNGAPDVTRNDGIYARYFTRFSGKGRYAVTAQVTDDGKASIREVGFTGSRSMPIVNKFQTKLNVTEKETGSFQRESSSGSFDIENDLNEDDVDLFPPNRIADLRVVYISEDNSNITFRWTAPGDDYDSGTASSYDIRYSSNWTQLKQNFTNCDRSTIELVPLPSGSEQSVNLSLPGLSRTTTIFVALKAADKGKQMSAISNIVSVKGVFPATTPTEFVSTATPTSEPSTADAETESPTYAETESSTYAETESPTYAETESPTSTDTDSPILADTESPTYDHTQSPTYDHTQSPTYDDTQSPTYTDTESPTHSDTESPTYGDTESPIYDNTESPTYADTESSTYANTKVPAAAATTDKDKYDYTITIVCCSVIGVLVVAALITSFVVYKKKKAKELIL